MPPMRGPSFGFQEAAAIGDQGDGAAVESRVGAEHFGRVLGLELEVVVAIEDAEDDVFDFVRQSMIGGQDAVEIFGRTRGRSAGRSGGGSGSRRNMLADHVERSCVVLGHVVGDAADAVWSFAPPRDSASMTWPVAPLTRFGPPKPMKLVFSTMIKMSLSAGR